MGNDIARAIARNAKKKKQTGPVKSKRFQRQTIVADKRDLRPVMVDPENFGSLEVDRRYQRDENEGLILDIWDSLDRGGMIVGRVTLAKRAFKDDQTDPQKLYIVDGQQRKVASEYANKSFPADIIESKSLDDERDLFRVLNTRAGVNANIKVHSSSGPVGELLRRICADEEHPMFNTIDFGFRGTHGLRKYPAAPVVKSIVALCSDSVASGNVDRIIARGNVILQDEKNVRRTSLLLRLIPLCFGHVKSVRLIPLISVAKVARKKFALSERLPTTKQCRAIGNLNWDLICPTSASVHIPSAKVEIEKRWR